MKQTAIEDLQILLTMQRAAFAQESMPSLATRLDRLNKLLAMARKHALEIAAAISADFGNRSVNETFLLELATLEEKIKYCKKHLPRWMKQRRLSSSPQHLFGKNRVLPQPLGVIGILSPWNYPFDLCMGPALDALAAGNRVMLKPSELCPRLSDLLAKLVAEYFDPSVLTVVQGDASVAASFSSLPFNHLVFTGSTEVGRIVAQAAAKNLTPVTLELGGKSPAIVDADVDLAIAAKRIAWGKLINAGQTCVAPDYLLVPQEQETSIVAAIGAAMQSLYPRLADNKDYTSIINARQWQRLQDLLADATQHGAKLHVINPAAEQFDPALKKMAPVIVTGVTADMRLMKEEIFGPILPVMTYKHFDEVVNYVNQRARPLAVYWFGNDHTHRDQVLRQTISGGVCINDCLLHVGQPQLAFGGVGPSGQGAYHGEAGFNSFSKLKPIFIQSNWNVMGFAYPPYGKLVAKMLSMFTR